MCWVGNHLFIRRQNYKLALEFFHSFLKLFFFPAFWKDVTLWELTVTLEPLVLCPSIHGSKKPRQCLLELSIWRKRDWEIVGLLSYLWSSPVTWRARSWNCIWGLGLASVPDSLNGSRQPPQEESREGFIAIPEWSFLIPQRGQGTLLCSRPCYLDIFSLHITCIRIRSPQVIRAGLSLREILRGPNHDDKWRKDRSQRSAILNILFWCKVYIEKGLSLSSEFFPFVFIFIFNVSY